MTLLQNDRSNSALISFIKGTFKRMKKVSSSQSLHGTTIPLDPGLLHAHCIFLNKVLHCVSYRLSFCSFGLMELLDVFFFLFKALYSLTFSRNQKKKKHKNENSTAKPIPFYCAKQTKKITLCDQLKTILT